MSYARVAVDSGRPQREPFTYAVPTDLAIGVGQGVLVPFGRQVLQGVVLALEDSSEIAEPRPIHSLIDETPLLTPAQIELALWISDYYRSAIFESAALFLAPGFSRKPLRMLRPAPIVDASALQPLSPRQREVLTTITGRAPISIDRLDALFDGKTAPTVRALLKMDLLDEVYTLAAPKLHSRVEQTVSLAVSAEAARAAIQAWPRSKRSRQADLVEGLLAGPLPLAEARRLAGGRAQLERGVVPGRLVEFASDETVRLRLEPDAAHAVIDQLRRNAAERRAVAVLQVLLEGARTPADLHSVAGANRKDVDALIDQGLVVRESVEVERDPLAGRPVARIDAAALTNDQQEAYATIGSALNVANADRREAAQSDMAACIFLLRGVTGSGKTEVYLAAVDHTLSLGLRSIVMVPEIALTPQTVDRFRQRFERVAVWHSGLSAGERFDTWNRIREGRVDVVVGSRSALFTPLPELGLIVIDEEHEWTYKQTEPAPRYHVREVVEQYARLIGAVVVFGSATPDVVTTARARAGQYTELELPQRVQRIDAADPKSPLQSAPLPAVEVVDMRAELKEGNRSIFSRALAAAIDDALSNDEQVILFLNRRGAASLVCRSCGTARECERCSVPYTYHAPIDRSRHEARARGMDRLRCHECGRSETPSDVCPTCREPSLRPMGHGTQDLEQEVEKRFLLARALRFDRDTAAARDGHERILRRFREGEANVLVGTQMIAKGHDIPAVTVVGVVNADLALRFPDYTGPERTFQLLTQVAGRAGRGPRGGRVVIQTYAPDHYAITAAAAHDYETFLAQELPARAPHDYPPYGRLARLVFASSQRPRAHDTATEMARSLIIDRDRRGLPGPEVLGPTPAFIYRRRNQYRFQITLRGADPLPLLRGVEFRGWSVDIDPVSLL